LIGAEHPAAALIIDTGTVMNIPDLNGWKTSSDNPLFIVPCPQKMEPPLLKGYSEIYGNSGAASGDLAGLCRDGRILEGIYQDRIGWFIGVPVPERELLEAQMKLLDLVVKTFGQFNTRLMVLAREMQRAVPGIPLAILTQNASLGQALEFVGINSVLFSNFTLCGLEKALSGVKTGWLDWDEILRDIQTSADKNLIQVEMSLTSRSAAPVWINGGEQDQGQAPILMAQGTGVVHASTDLRFNWTLPYKAWDFPEIKGEAKGLTQAGRESDEKAGGITPGRLYLDFGSAGHLVSAGLMKALMSKIRGCAFPLSYIQDIPTVQDPLSVIKQFMLYEYAYSERNQQDDLNRDALADFESNLRHTENLMNWTYYWLRNREASQRDADVSLGDFLHALRSCWNIGETFKFTLLDNEAEIGLIKEEAEG